MILSLAIATRDDPFIWSTVNALMIYHPHIFQPGVGEIVIEDNSPISSPLYKQVHDHFHNWHNENVVKHAHNQASPSSCLHKERAISRCTGDIVIVCDSHVFFPPGALDALIEYHQGEGKDRKDIASGPCMIGPHQVQGTNQMVHESEPYDIPKGAAVFNGWVWRGRTLGCWVNDPRGAEIDNPPFEIKQQGTGCFSFRRDNWWGFHPSFKGFGGCESYLFEKVRRSGGRAMCVPAARWMHSWVRVQPPYSVTWEDRVRNYLVGFRDLGDRELYDSCVQAYSGGDVIRKAVAAYPFDK